MTRTQLIAILIQNDSNGCYSDEDNIAEGLPLLTYEIAKQLVEEMEQE